MMSSEGKNQLPDHGCDGGIVVVGIDCGWDGFQPWILPRGSRLVAANAQVQVWEIEARPSELQESRFDISWLKKSPSHFCCWPSLSRVSGCILLWKESSSDLAILSGSSEVNSKLSMLTWGRTEYSRRAVHHYHDETLSLQ